MKVSLFVKSVSFAAVIFAALFLAGCATAKSKSGKMSQRCCASCSCEMSKESKCCATMASCSKMSSCAMKQTSQDFSIVKGKVWQLAQVRDSSGSITFDSSKLDKTIFGDIYTLEFKDGLAFGKAAPNRYTGPFELGKGDGISFKHAASTMMLGINTPQGLSETEYFKLLEKVTRWNFEGNQLSLYTSEGNVLVFQEFDYR